MLNSRLMAELLGGMGRFQALQCLYEQPDRAFGTRELATEAGIDASNASRWLRRWADVGLVERRVERGLPVFKASSDRTLMPLAMLMQQASRTVEVLRERVSELGKAVEAAAIFGSGARGTATRDSDIDLLLVTALPRLKAQALFKATGRELGRPVNVLAYTLPAWRDAVASGDPLASEILEQPWIPLKGDLHAAAST